jgi:REP element-mobilizing transposase RayT
MTRENNREDIFGKVSKKVLIRVLKNAGWRSIGIAAYCIMDNYVHIVVKANISHLSKAIKRINIKYAMNFKQKRDGIGHVFQERFKSGAIEDDKYLVQSIRYIHNNSVTEKMVKSPSDFNWSSYNEYINKNVIIESKQREFILEYFSHNLEQLKEFHKQKDNNEYLEVKEDIENARLERAQEIISKYFEQRGLIVAKQVIKNPVFLEE